MELSEAIEKLKKFDCTDCKFAACEQCEINYGEVQALRTVLAVLAELDKQTGKYEQGYNDGYLAGAMESI